MRGRFAFSAGQLTVWHKQKAFFKSCSSVCVFEADRLRSPHASRAYISGFDLITVHLHISFLFLYFLSSFLLSVQKKKLLHHFLSTQSLKRFVQKSTFLKRKKKHWQNDYNVHFSIFISFLHYFLLSFLART